MTVKLKTPSNGSVSLTPQDTASDVVLTVPATTGVVNTSGVVNQVPAGSASAPSVYPTGDSNTGLFFPAADTVAVATGGAERYRVDSSGNLLVGTTSNTEGARIFVSYPNSASGGAAAIGTEVNDTQTLRAISFRNPNGLVGTITTSGSSAAYNTSSDYRLKENIQPMTGALAKVAQLKPVTYTWKADGSNGQGFIAHELQAVVPDAVTGEKDAVDDEGNPQYQGVDTSFLVATLTAAIQEQQAIINSLQDRITALENA